MNRRTVGKMLVLPVLLLLSVPVAAQTLELPAPSPAAKVSQRVGVVDVGVEYSSPGVKGRTIWGDLVPWDQVWRTGANAATKITFSHDVSFGGTSVPAGSYTLVTMPTKKGWTVMLNKDLGMWSGGKPYDAAQDVAKVSAKTAKIPKRERMTFLFSDTTEDATSLDLEWDELRVSVPIQADTKAMALANIDNAQKAAARTNASAARYLMEHAKEYDRAEQLIDLAIAADPSWFYHWVKADILSRKGDYAAAHAQAQTAWELGEKSSNFFFKDQVQKALAEWKDKK